METFIAQYTVVVFGTDDDEDDEDEEEYKATFCISRSIKFHGRTGDTSHLQTPRNSAEEDRHKA